MALPVREQAKYWGVSVAAFLAILWFLGDVILPFVLGGAIAYMLDPIADRLEKLGLSRLMSVIVITLFAAFIFILLILLVIPTLTEQTAQMINEAPALIDKLQLWLATNFPDMADQDSTIRHQLEAFGEAIQSKGGALFNSVVSSALSLINVLVLLVVVPVVTFYLLLDWDNMVAKIDGLIPLDHVNTIRGLARDIDRTLASFIRGQGTVCILLGAFYGIGLALVGLKFGFVAGAIAGALTFIPYVGSLVGGTLSIGLALFQYWGSVPMADGTTGTDWARIGIVAGIFAIGQFFEGNILSPKLVGSSVGLHPVWLIFALTTFGSLFGFVGMLVAVPVTAMIGVLVRFGLTHYRTGRLYQGLAGLEAQAAQNTDSEK